MGWKVPDNYNELLELKKKCDENNILFAVTAGCAAGHGFNWLFELMGAQWISTLEGSEWFDNYINGKESIDKFAEQSEYFKRYFEDGLFGYFYNKDWNESTYYRQQRAFISYDLTNNLYSAIRLNKDGTVHGAKYDKNGQIVANENEQGKFVYLNESWTVYDENNILHDDLQRYDIPGASVDEFAAMPWISEDGSNNRFTCYDQMFCMINKKLEEECQKEKLEDVLKVLEFMCTENATKYFSASNLDAYVSVNDFKITEDRTYFKYADDITAGYIQPWYYSLVDMNTLIKTGEAVNDYLSGGKTTFEDCLKVIDENNSNNLNSINTSITNVQETFEYEDVAKLLACVGAKDLQKKIKDNNIDKEITVSLMPYTEKLGDMAPFSCNYLGIVSTKLYAGEFNEIYVGTLLPAKCLNAVAIEMTGNEINKIIKNKLDRSGGGENYDSSYGPYPYVMITKNGESIDENKTYLVTVNEFSLNAEDYEYFKRNERILKDSEENFISGDIRTALVEYMKENSVIAPDIVDWTE